MLMYRHIRSSPMKLVDAIYTRIIEFAKERTLSINALANLSGVPRTTIISIPKCNTVNFSTIYGICEGLDIALKDFFDSPLFDRENIED